MDEKKARGTWTGNRALSRVQELGKLSMFCLLEREIRLARQSMKRSHSDEMGVCALLRTGQPLCCRRVRCLHICKHWKWRCSGHSTVNVCVSLRGSSQSSPVLLDIQRILSFFGLESFSGIAGQDGLRDLAQLRLADVSNGHTQGFPRSQSLLHRPHSLLAVRKVGRHWRHLVS